VNGVPIVPPVPPIPPGNGSKIGWFTPFVAVEEPAATDTTRPATQAERGWLVPATTPTAPKEAPDATENGSAATKSVPDTEPRTIRTTAAGLPRRKPGGGSMPKPADTTAAKTPAAETQGTGFRDPEAIRNNLSRHYSGVQAARRTREEPDSEAERKN
jgi:hypothetical protein